MIFLEKAEKIEKILERLTHVGVGKRPKTSVRYCVKLDRKLYFFSVSYENQVI